MRKLVWILLSVILVSCGSGQDRDSWSSKLDAVETEVLYDPGVIGPFKVASFTPTTRVNGYRSAIVYYPSNSLDPLLPATTLTGGFTNTKEDMTWLGQHLASHGFVTIIFTPTNPNALNAQVWANGHKASLEALKLENLKLNGPLEGRIDIDRLGVMGYSFGGAGAILAANQLGKAVRSAVPLCAYNPVTPTNPIPFMFLTGTNDTVAQPGRILSVFNRFNSSSPKAFVKLNRLGHGDITNGGKNHESIARFVTAWNQVFLAEKPAYDTWLTGEEAQKQIDNRSIFAKASDYIYID